MAGHKTPAKFLPDVVGVGFRVKLKRVDGFRLHSTLHVSGGDDKGVITAGTDARRIIAASDGGLEQRTAIVIRTVYVNDRVGRR